jgi:pyruvate formate lyase activating enzyme
LKAGGFNVNSARGNAWFRKEKGDTVRLGRIGMANIATAGCNFDCKFCQNYEISQARPEETANFDMPPEVVVEVARRTGCRSIASTYVEPTVFYEYMYDIGSLAKKAGILNVCHSNGYINQKPLRALCRVLDAACIDLKGFTRRVLSRTHRGGTLAGIGDP